MARRISKWLLTADDNDFRALQDMPKRVKEDLCVFPVTPILFLRPMERGLGLHCCEHAFNSPSRGKTLCVRTREPDGSFPTLAFADSPLGPSASSNWCHPNDTPYLPKSTRLCTARTLCVVNSMTTKPMSRFSVSTARTKTRCRKLDLRSGCRLSSVLLSPNLKLRSATQHRRRRRFPQGAF
jgi:hypothetical protein